ncbi:MAG: carboxypeptidase-like regulatory domain-containing protein [Bacteroidales bacterium]|nr:carboxypeptidase-like regulatory domain-containing protein [Bacteroidales bacterium]
MKRLFQSTKLIACLMTALLCATIGLSAQGSGKSTLEGVVTDASGNPLPGVAVMGGAEAVITDLDGAYSVKIPAQGAEITFSCLGFSDKKVTVNAGQSRLNVTMEDDILALEETVVVGYGTQKKVNLTGAISVVESKSISNRSQSSLSHILQGSVPGLNVTTSSGRPEYRWRTLDRPQASRTLADSV